MASHFYGPSGWVYRPGLSLSGYFSLYAEESITSTLSLRLQPDRSPSCQNSIGVHHLPYRVLAPEGPASQLSLCQAHSLFRDRLSCPL